MHLLSWWNLRDILPSGHLEDIQEELCRQSELSSARMHKEPETTSRLSAHYLRPSGGSLLRSPASHKQKTQFKQKMKWWWKNALLNTLTFVWTYISTKHVVRLPDKDPIEPNWWNGVHTIENKKHLLFGSVKKGDSVAGNTGTLKTLKIITLTSAERTQ